jgi:hypothetical protein
LSGSENDKKYHCNRSQKALFGITRVSQNTFFFVLVLVLVLLTREVESRDHGVPELVLVLEEAEARNLPPRVGNLVVECSSRRGPLGNPAATVAAGLIAPSRCGRPENWAGDGGNVRILVVVVVIVVIANGKRVRYRHLVLLFVACKEINVNK